MIYYGMLVVIAICAILLSLMAPDSRKWLPVGLFILAVMPCVTWCLWELDRRIWQQMSDRVMEQKLAASTIRSREWVVIDDRGAKVPAIRYRFEFPAGSGEEHTIDHRLHDSPHRRFVPIFFGLGGFAALGTWGLWLTGNHVRNRGRRWAPHD